MHRLKEISPNPQVDKVILTTHQLHKMLAASIVFGVNLAEKSCLYTDYYVDSAVEKSAEHIVKKHESGELSIIKETSNED